MDYTTAHRLADELRQCEEYTTYHRLKEAVMENETQAALIAEYGKIQTLLQMYAVTGESPSEEEKQRYSGLVSLLYSKPEVNQYLLAEMRLQQVLADIFKIVTDAAGIDMHLP